MCVHLLDQENQARFSTISETKILKCCGEGYWPKQVAVSKNWVRSAACCLITKSLYIYNLSIIYMYMPSLASDLPHRTHRCRSTRSRLPLPKEAMCPAVASSNVRQVLGFLECMLYIYMCVCISVYLFFLCRRRMVEYKKMFLHYCIHYWGFTVSHKHRRVLHVHLLSSTSVFPSRVTIAPVWRSLREPNSWRLSSESSSGRLPVAAGIHGPTLHGRFRKNRC